MSPIKAYKKTFLSIIGLLCLILIFSNAFAGPTTSDIYENVLDRFHTASQGWALVILIHASRLFWTLALISMVWTFGIMALRRADIGEFFSELVRFIIFTGLFWWFLTNGPSFSSTIIDSLRRIGGEATRLGPNLTPSSVVDIGFAIFFLTLDVFTVGSPVISSVAILLGFGVLALLALVAVNMLILLVSGWVLLYGGVFFLGFGGARWTSDLAINYYKTVLGVAASLFSMVLIVGVATSIIDQYYQSMANDVAIKELAVVMMVAFVMAMLVKSIPPLISGIITGASISQTSSGSFGAGTIVGAAGMAAAAVATGSAAIAAGASNAVGSTRALMASYHKESEGASFDENGFTRGMGVGSLDVGAQHTKDTNSVSSTSHVAGESIIRTDSFNENTSAERGRSTSASTRYSHANGDGPHVASSEGPLDNNVATRQTRTRESAFHGMAASENNFLMTGRSGSDSMEDEIRDFVNRPQSPS